MIELVEIFVFDLGIEYIWISVYIGIIYYSFILMLSSKSYNDTDTIITIEDEQTHKTFQYDTKFDCLFIDDDEWLCEKDDNELETPSEDLHHTTQCHNYNSNQESMISTYRSNTPIPQYNDQEQLLSMSYIEQTQMNTNTEIDDLFKDETYISDTYQTDEEDGIQYGSMYSFCCLCGLDGEKHIGKNHLFIRAKDEYRCKKCKLFYYQHNHLSNPCFQPTKWILDD